MLLYWQEVPEMFWNRVLTIRLFGECNMLTFEELRAMYDRGQTQDVINALQDISIDPATEDGQRYLTLKGWCHYRRKENKEAHNCAIAAKALPWARELMAYLHAYAPAHIDDEALMEIANELGSTNINVANAFVIRARADDCSILTGDEVDRIAASFRGDESVHAANLMHNAGRFFLAKPKRPGDLQRATQYLDDAIRRYGTEANFHHRAAANFWKSQAFEKIGWKAHAVDAAQESVRLWEEQCKLDPTNKSFLQKKDDAAQRLATLTA